MTRCSRSECVCFATLVIASPTVASEFQTAVITEIFNGGISANEYSSRPYMKPDIDGVTQTRTTSPSPEYRVFYGYLRPPRRTSVTDTGNP